MASTKGLVPITRSFLASYYDTKPFPPLSDDVSRLSSQIRALSSDLLSQLPPDKGESELVKEADRAAPHKVDENLWRNREYMEEILLLLEQSALHRKSTPEVAAVFDRLRQKFQRTLNFLVSFQATNSERVFTIVMTYLPQDFRGTLIRQQRERSERNKQAEVDAVINSGGSIHDKYALLWGQQMDRRRQLAQLGSATGVYKTLVKYLVGVPEVLLDFVRQINDDNGPMEEQRSRYGPHAYCLTSMVLKIRLFIELSRGRFHTKTLEKDELAILEKAVDVYTSEFERFITFISDVFANSPFFISAEEAGAIEGRKTNDFREISIPAGKTHEVSLTVDTLNSYIAWDYSLVQSKMSMTQDIGFSIECTSPSGEKTSILPYRRYESDQGNICTCKTGNYKLVWDNTYSSFFKKTLQYKVDCIPSVAEPLQSTIVVNS